MVDLKTVEFRPRNVHFLDDGESSYPGKGTSTD